MKKLIKVGGRYINLANVYHISFQEHTTAKLQATLDVIASASMYPDSDENVTGPIEPVGMLVFGEEAEALRYYLDSKAIDLDLDYHNYLVQQELKRYRADWRVRFNQFCQEKELDQDTIYHYEWWLNEGEDGPALDGKQPGEETFAAWLSVAEEQITERIEKMGIPAKDREAFKAHCVAVLTTNPSWNTYKFWKNEQPASAEI